jgi:alkyl hydroperoxide reductase subunit AhpC
MVELGELERQHAEFADRRVRVVVISNDSQKTAQATQNDFPDLLVISDVKQNMARAFGALHAGAGPTGDDTNAPTTFLVDGAGQVRWLFRARRFVTRLSPERLLKTIDRTLDGE